MSGRRGRLTAAIVATITILLADAVARPAAAQVVPEIPPELLQDSTPPGRVSPRGAMIRSFLLPGWGQAAVGSYFRGGIFFTIEGSSWYMLLRTLARYNQAKQVLSRVEGLAMDSLDILIAMDTAAARRLGDPSAYAAAVTNASGVIRSRALVNSRRQQRQDWITYTLFFTLMSGVDAYVNAHLKDMPVDISSRVQPDGGLGISVRVAPPEWLGGTPRGPASAASPVYQRRRR
jgi:hypothetical protein